MANNDIFASRHLGWMGMFADNPLSTNLRRLWKGSPPLRGVFPPPEEMVQQAYDVLREHEATGLQNLVACQIAKVRRFDITGMQRIVAIIACGRSGADLLASYLEGHGDVLTLPPLGADRIYQFFESYRALPLYEKLISYPIFSRDSFYSDFFKGAFPIDAARYYATVKALLQVFRDHEAAFLASSRTFVLFLHVAYCVARGQEPDSPRPLIVYAQHASNNELAKRLVHDFPQARFIHTVRDPITNCARAFENRFQTSAPPRFLVAAYVMWNLTLRDVPQRGMGSRTAAVKFEDLHTDLERTMRAVANWLDLSFQSSLLRSTYNGAPWVVERGGASWTGARPDQTVRDLRYTSSADRALLFALLNEGFVAWDYPFPRAFGHAAVRCMTCAFAALIPMKMEFVGIGSFFKDLASGRESLRHSFGVLAQVLASRTVISAIVLTQICRRLWGPKVSRLSLIAPRQPTCLEPVPTRVRVSH